jgi:cytokinin trans-hydroxylase
MALLLFTGLLVLTIILAYIYLKRRYILTDINLPGTKPQILFGNLLNSGLLSGKFTFHEVMHNYQRQYGDKFVFWFGSHPFLTFCLPEHAQTIFNDRRFEQSPLFLANFDLICPSNITVLTGARWKRHARIMLPFFKRAKVIQHLDTIIECTDRFIDQYLNENEIHRNLVDHCQKLTMNIIGFIGFDYDLENYGNSRSKVNFPDFVFHATSVMFMAWLPRWMIKIYLKFNWKFQRIYRQMRELMERIVEQEQNNQDTTEKERPKNFIASLVSSLNDEQISSGLTRPEMFDEVLTVILAGSETTSTALAWFIFYMSKNPHIQQRIKEELRQHDLLMTNDVQCLPSLTQEKLDLLTYCECVIKEVCVFMVYYLLIFIEI